MATDVEQVPKSWIHEPERAAAARSEKIDRYLKNAELPSALSGLGLLLLGRKFGGASGRAIGALGSTLLMSAAGRFAFRKSKGRLKNALPSVFSGVAPVDAPPAEVIP